MKIKCEYCENYMDDSSEKCPSCGAPNMNIKRTGVGVPTTIDELKQWYEEHNLPPYETTRFFIGINYDKPKAFGIYKDDKTGKFVVYKNKDTGARAVRYEGTDEKYAVNELYLKLKEEIKNQKNLNNKKGSGLKPYEKVIFYLLCIFMVVLFFINNTHPDRGYYNINDTEYYYVHGNWYVYDNYDWSPSSKPSYSGDLDDYFEGEDYQSTPDYTDIKQSDVYDEEWESSDWDSDSSWGSGDSWDSGGTDWGSDW